MDYHRWSQRAEWGLVAAIIGLHAIILLWQEDSSRPNFVLATAHDAQLLAAIVLIVAWAILGPGRLWIRLAASPVFVWLWFLPWNSAMQPREMTAGFIGTFFCAAAVLICGLWGFGLRVARRAAADGIERGAQFSLFALLAATTATATIIGLLEALRPTLQQVRPFDGWVYSVLSPIPLSSAAQQTRHIVMATAVAVSAVGGLWVALRPGGIWIRLTATMVLIVVGSLYLSHLAGTDILGLTGRSLLVPTAASLASGLASVAGLSALSVLPLRLMGFRLRRPLRSATQSMVQSADYLPLMKRVAAILLLGAAIGIVPLSRLLERQNLAADPRRVNGGAIVWGHITATTSAQIEPPLAAFGRWIEPTEIWTDNLSLIWGGGQYVHPQPELEIDFSDISAEADGRKPAEIVPAAGFF